MAWIRTLLYNSRGATAIEYSLIAALIAVVAMSGMRTLGKNVKNTFTNVSNNLSVS